MNQPTFRDIEKLLKKGEGFAPGSTMELAARAARNILMTNALSALDGGASIAIQLKHGAIVRYVWDKQSRGWQATL
jgi:hypothetical protein